MKMNFVAAFGGQKLTLITGMLAIATVTFGQKTNETSAAVEYKNKYQTAMMKGDMEGAKKGLLSAKKFIDLAAVHPETMESAKTLFYKGEIYSAATAVALQSGDQAFLANFGDDSFDQAIAAYKKSYAASSKFRPDITESVNEKINVIAPLGNAAYEAGKYAEAGQVFYTQYQLASAKGVNDSISLYNAGFCLDKAEMLKEAAEAYEELTKVGYKGATSYALAGSAYSKIKDYEKARKMLEAGRAKYGNDKDLLMESVRLNIAMGDAKGAEGALNEAIAKDPDNKQLHYIIGTIYTDLKENEKAEVALNRALELDPDYLEAQYNLGAHLVTWGSDLKQKANNMDIDDPNYKAVSQQSDEIFKRALIPLEKYIAKEPNDANVLLILYQLHYNLGNSEKSADFKKRYEAAKK